MAFRQYALVQLVLVAGALAQAQTTLFLPGFDPQPLSVDVAGVDAQGRTTYILQTGALTDTNQDYGFIGTGTLVEGSDYASFTYDNAGVTLGYDCSISGATAVCSADGQVETMAVEGLVMQVGTTATGGAPASSPTGNASPSSESSKTGSSASPTPSNDKDYAINNSPAWGLGALVSSIFLFVSCI